MSAYYNEIDPHAAAWLRNLIAAGHMAAVAALGCLICQQPAQVHHIRDGAGMGQRSGHDETVPLCERHHTGAEGFHTLGPQTFAGRFGMTEREMLAETKRRLGI